MFESKKEILKEYYRMKIDSFRLISRLAELKSDNVGRYYSNTQTDAFYNTFLLLGFNDGKVYKDVFEREYTKAENDLYKLL